MRPPRSQICNLLLGWIAAGGGGGEERVVVVADDAAAVGVDGVATGQASGTKIGLTPTAQAKSRSNLAEVRLRLSSCWAASFWLARFLLCNKNPPSLQSVNRFKLWNFV